MNFLVVLVLIVFGLSSRVSSYQEYSAFVTDEDLEHQFFSDELEETNFTSDSEELNKLKQESNVPRQTTVDAAKFSFPSTEKGQSAKGKRNGAKPGDGSKNFEMIFDHPYEHLPSNLKQEDEITSEKLLDHFSKIHHKVYSNYEESFHKKEKDPGQPPMRREINTWREEFPDANNVPWSLDAFYPRHGSPGAQNDYFDDTNYPVDSLEQRNYSTTESPENLKEIINQDDQLPYYQKNYYYNYYPLTKSRKFNKIPKWSMTNEQDSDEIIQSRENSSGRKFMRKNACKQYLQFLKYAFEKLDENPDYNYDYNDDYSEEWREKGGQRNQKVFAVHLLGPTLYVDNSGKVSQINTKGNSYQNIDAASPIPKFLTVKNEEIKEKPTTSSSFMQRVRTERLTTLPSEIVYDQLKTTTEIPWLNISLKTNLTASNITKEQNLSPEIHHRSSIGTRIEEEWRQQMRDEVYETTMRTKTEHTVFDEYDYGDTKSAPPFHNTYPPKWFPSEEYYRKLAKGLGKDSNNNNTKSNVISSETNAAVAPALYWFSKTSPPQTTTTTSPIFANSLRYEPIEISTDFGNRKDDDCNDKMLPCPDTVNVTYPLNGYCNRYVSCEAGRAIRKTCPEGLHFNLITRSCDLPHNSFCMYSCPLSSGFYGVPGDCGGYFFCKNLIPEYRMCPPRMHWDIRKNTCTFAELSSCPMKCTKANEVKHYEGDCKAYVICLNGIPYYHKCPPNTKFDKKAQTCIPYHQSKCEDDPRLLTKTSNPNHLCRDVEIKLGTKVWCNYFLPDETQKPRKQFEK